MAHVEIARERAGDDVVERLRDVSPNLPQGRDRAVHHLLEHVDRVLSAKESTPREAFPEHDRHREDVALHGAGAALVDALRSEIGELALHFVGARGLDAILGLGDTEVGEVRAAVASDEDVVRRHVAVNDVEWPAAIVGELVRGVKARERVARDPRGDAHVERASYRGQLPAQLGERRAFDIVHDDERDAAIEAELSDFDDVGVIDGRSEARLVDEHGQECLVAREVSVWTFDCDERRAGAAVRRSSEPDGRHSARREIDEQLVCAESLTRSTRRVGRSSVRGLRGRRCVRHG